MAGGIFRTQNKIRPGFYHRFTASPRERQMFGDLGVAALPLELNWGATKEIISIDADASTDEFMTKLGKPLEELILVRECLKRANTLLIWRVNSDGEYASLDMAPQPVVATARYPGVRGNDISVWIEADPDNDGRYIVTTFVDAITQYEQRNVANAEEIESNDWVDFSGTGAITAAAGGELTGGTNGESAVNDYNDFLTALETWDFNAFGLISKDPQLQEMFVAAARRYIDELGKMVQCVLADYAASYEAVTSLKNGVLLEDGTILRNLEAVAWYVGASSAAGPDESLTYTYYDGAVGPDTRLNDTQIKAAIMGGHVVFEAQKDDYGQNVAAVEQDINTLIRFTKDRPDVWRKNRIVRALFHLVNSLTRIWHLYYIGKVDNNEIGRALFKADLVSMMKVLVEKGAFRDFDAEQDIIIKQGIALDSVLACLWVQPVDAMEKMYFTVEVGNGQTRARSMSI